MKRTITCKSCRKSGKVRSFANDRVELAKQKGKTFTYECRHCGHQDEYHVNEVSAENNAIFNAILFLLMFSAIGVIAYYIINNFHGNTLYLVMGLPIGITIPGMIFFNYFKSENNKIRTFNKYRL